MKSLLSLGLCLVGVVVVWACNPHFPIRYLLLGDDEVVGAPGPLWIDPLKLLSETGKRRFSWEKPSQEVLDETRLTFRPQLKWTERRAIEEFTDAVSVGEWDEASQFEMIESFSRVREEILKARLDDESEEVYDFEGVLSGLAKDVPDEFRLYLEGACAYAAGDVPLAREAWAEVLNLPEDKRKYRSVWAAYMLGLTEDRVALKREKFRETRWLAGSGFLDSLGLAIESIGWEAKTYLDSGDLLKAFELYHWYSETSGGKGKLSMNIVVNRALDREGSDILSQVAENPNMRRYTTTYFLNQWDDSWTDDLSRWLTALESIELEDFEGAGRLAVLAYREGNIEQVQRWLSLASEEDALARWIQAKLMLREGRIEEGKSLLSALSLEIRSEDSDFLGSRSLVEIRREAALLRMSSGEFVQSFEMWMEGRDWMESAYIAENLLSLEQLKDRVDEAMLEPDKREERTPFGSFMVKSEEGKLRELLARRLMRLGRGQESLAYFDEDNRDEAILYLEFTKEAEESDSNQERAKNLWEAAKVARKSGMEIMGTELFPDFSVFEGNFELEDLAGMRAGRPEEEILKLSPEERRLLNALELERPRKRFHYRYVAADLAWEAASLMPDNEVITAEVLTTAGNWLKKRDPKAADRFFKALVIRCGETTLGRKAQEINWLPNL